MRKLYGTSRSRASRSLVALEEPGRDDEHVPIPPDAMREAPYRALNPNARIPCLDDDGTVLFQSLAINLYLAAKYGHSPTWPEQMEDRGRAYQWSFWIANEEEPVLIGAGTANARGDEDGFARHRARLERPFTVLNDHLEGRRYLLGAEHSIADVNVATSLSEPHEQGFVCGWKDYDLERYPHIAQWLDRCIHRRSHELVRGMSGAFHALVHCDSTRTVSYG